MDARNEKLKIYENLLHNTSKISTWFSLRITGKVTWCKFVQSVKELQLIQENTSQVHFSLVFLICYYFEKIIGMLKVRNLLMCFEKFGQ